ncbi:unnamed protein product [Polarella glacialis]|uniref:Uncharacterized protein n=1 Tax=Polarella glacialis TaxID=89957 RepID=A0A813L9Z2_POLGL|nr:unnamed protein product [Polarella glacialis]
MSLSINTAASCQQACWKSETSPGTSSFTIAINCPPALSISALFWCSSAAGSRQIPQPGLRRISRTAGPWAHRLEELRVSPLGRRCSCTTGAERGPDAELPELPELLNPAARLESPAGRFSTPLPSPPAKEQLLPDSDTQVGCIGLFQTAAATANNINPARDTRRAETLRTNITEAPISHCRFQAHIIITQGSDS